MNPLSHGDLIAFAVWLIVVLYCALREAKVVQMAEDSLKDRFSKAQNDSCQFEAGVHGLSTIDVLDSVRSIEMAAFGRDSRWSEADFFEARRVGADFSVMESAPGIFTGYVMFLMVPGKRVEILRIAVRPSYRLKGVGKALIDWTLTGAHVVDAKELICEVDDRQLGMHLFLQSQGFEAVEIVKQENHSDLYRFRFDLASVCGEAAKHGRFKHAAK